MSLQGILAGVFTNTGCRAWFRPIQPFLAKPFHLDRWVYEEQLDGWRIVAPRTAILDGELAVFDDELVSRFHFLNDTCQTARS